MATTKLDTARPGALVYEQTMRLGAGSTAASTSRSRNAGAMAVYGIAFPAPNVAISAKAMLPQTFLDIAAKQAERAESV